MRKLPAYTIYLIISGAFSLLFTMMAFISAIYRVQTAGLNPLQLVLLGTALEVSIFLFEVPTGVVADVVSRRLSVIVGYALIGAGFVLEGALPLFGTILLAQVVWGVGYTFISGAEDAWLADEIGEERLTGAYLKASQLGRMGSLAGIFISVALGMVRPGLPISVAGFLVVALALFLALFMPETGFAPTPRPERSRWQKMGDTFADGLRLVRGRSLLILILAITAFFGLYSETLDRLWEAHMLQTFTFPSIGQLREPVIWFGAIRVSVLFLGLAVTEYLRRRIPDDREDVNIVAQLTLNAIVIGGLIAFGLAANFGVALVAIMAIQVFRSAVHPLFRAWINRQIEPQVRATVLSMNGQIDAIGQIAGGPLMGLLATRTTIATAMVGAGLLLSPVLLLYGVALRWEKRQPAVKAGRSVAP